MNNPFFIDRWPPDRDPCERLAIAMMDAQFAQADDHAHRLLLESQVDALESEMHERGIIDDLDIVADLISIPGLNRVDFDSLEGVDDESDDEIYGAQQSPAGQDEPEG